MNNPESLSQLLQVCARKTEDFVRLLDCKHVVWLMEIEEAAKKMFSSDFTAEPELMPKTPSQKRRRKKRTSIVPDENRDPSGRRISRRRSGASWSSSVRRLSARQLTKPLDESIQEEPTQPKRLTRARAQASAVCIPVSEKPLEELSLNLPADRILQVKISAKERRSAELQLVETLALGTENLEAFVPAVSEAVIEASTLKTSAEPPAPITPEKHSRTAAKLKIASNSTPKSTVEQVVDLIIESAGAAEVAKELALELSRHSITPTGSKSDRRSVRRSIVGRKSISCRPSLANQYSLTKKRESMTKEAVRKSIRRSISKKKAMESSSSSCKSYHSSIEVVDEEISVKIRPEAGEPPVEARSPDSPRRSLPTRACKKIAISNLPETEEPPRMATRQSLKSDETCQETDDQALRRKSYKRAVDELSDEHPDDDQVMSPPRKKTPSPTCRPSKVVKPLPPHMKTFLHTVQKNQLLMMTPGSISKSLVKSFIKRNTPLKTDLKTEEKERQRLEALRKKEEAELQRRQKIEEGKKRKQEELKLKREDRLRKVLQARERVEQLEEEKKKKVEQKYAQIDEKSEKVREDRVAEEKAKKKIAAKKQEDVESRRRQEEEGRKLKAKQLEEEERRQEELLLKKREEEDQERQKKLAEAKKLAEERERQRELQLAAEKEQERLRAEREGERIEKEKALQLRKELERAAQEKEQKRREAEECKRKEQQARLEQERLCKDMEAKRLKELEAQRQREDQQAVANDPVLNVTVDLVNSPACESYEMTPKGYKPHPPKITSEDYGMDLNSDDSTDDESRPRKPIPAWASGSQLSQSIHQQYHRPINVNKTFGKIESPDLELLFSKSKPRYNKRTSSAVWHSPPLSSNRQHLPVGYGLKKF